MKKRLVIGNWKMYIESPEAAKKFAQALKRKAHAHPSVEVWLAPSFTLIPALAGALGRTKLKIGGQGLSVREGAHTGEVSARMLKGAGASFCIVGHSERRAMGESNEAVRIQLVRAAQEGLVPVLCVGELERDSQGAHFSFVEEQIASALRAGPVPKLVVAYEPIWAIGALQAMVPADIEEMIIFIRKTLAQFLGRETADKTRILYGGSVEGENAAAILDGSGASGLLVGRASADIDSFLKILIACKK